MIWVFLVPSLLGVIASRGLPADEPDLVLLPCQHQVDPQFQKFTNHHLPHTNSNHSLLLLNARNSSNFSNNDSCLITSGWNTRVGTTVLLKHGPMTLLLLPCTPLCIVLLTLNGISSGGNVLV